MPEPVRIRASSLSDLFDCPARWEAKHLLKMRLPTSSAAQIGTAIHAGAAAYDESRIFGSGLSVDDTAGAVVDCIWKPDSEVDWQETSQSEAEKIAIPLHRMYCQKISPTQDYLAVESACDDLTISDLGITLTGTVDRVRKTEDGLGISDLKTGKTAVDKDGIVNIKGHAMQLGVYEILAAHALKMPIEAPAQIIGLQVAKTDKGRRVGIGEIGCAKEALLDGDNGEPGLLRLASKIIHGGSFYGNPRSSLCSEKFCPAYKTCRWR